MMIMERHDKPVELVDIPHRSMLVLYGSETGNSQDVAYELGRMAQRLHFKTHIEEMNAVQLNEVLRHTLVVMVVSTTGQGDMPHNALLFWKSLLRKKLPPYCLGNVRFTSFGLGDSSYPKFNWTARKLHKRMQQLGAVEFYPRGEADEQNDDGIDETYIPWSIDLRVKLLEQYPLPSGVSPIPHAALLPPRYQLPIKSKNNIPGSSEHARLEALEHPPSNDLKNLANLKIDNDRAESGASLMTNSSAVDSSIATDLVPDSVLAVLNANDRITPPGHSQSVRKLRFHVHGIHQQAGLIMNPGDCLRIYPQNQTEDAEKIIRLMQWENVADQPIDIQSMETRPTGLYCSRWTSIRRLLTSCLDITAVPRRSFLEAISHHCTDDYQKERLLEFTRSEYIDEYYDYATRPRRSIIEVLEEFHSVRIPADYIFDVFPIIRGRDYSIASIEPVPAVDKLSYIIELVVALVQYRTVLRKVRTGLCSRYLAPLTPGSAMIASHRPTLTQLFGPHHARRPLCAIATGTGIAPARALIQERLRHDSPATPAGRALLIFGNRNREKDFFFQDEWESIPPEKLHVYTAFSRDQRQKVYVQDIVLQNRKAIADTARDGGIFIVCGGSTKMATDCRQGVARCILAEGVVSTEADAQAFVNNMTWWQEIW